MQKTGTPNEYRRELKTKILDYAMSEFRVKGIRAVKMDDIAKALSISKRTVYEIYNDKEEILIDGMGRQFDLAREEMVRVLESTSNVIELLAAFYKIHVEQTTQVSPVFYTDVEKYPKALEFIHQKGQERDKQAAGFFERGVKEGFFRENIDYDVIMDIGKNTSEAIMRNQLFTKYPMQKVLKNMLILYLRGVCTLKGVEMLDELI